MSLPVILCVDDEEIVLESLEIELNDAFGDTHEIEVAQSGAEALEIIDEVLGEGRQLHVVVADYIMPKMRGDELLVKTHERTPHTLKVMLTGQSSVEGITNAINQANLYRYIAKPWEQKDLVLTVREAIGRFEREREIIAKNERLAEQNDELRELNRTLDDKVKERTAQLAEKTESLEKLNAVKDRLFSVISHDLRSPLGALTGVLQLLEHKLLTEEELRMLSADLGRSVNSTLGLLDNLLQWARSQMGGTAFSPIEIDLAALADENVNLLAAVAENKGITLASEIEADTRICADADMVKLILRNLMSNALKFTPQGGKVTARASRVDGDWIEVSVTDTGMGISEENKAKLFRDDEIVTTVGTANEKGTGLGLTLCKEYAQRHGGTIRVESQEGQGSSFLFTLPVTQQALETGANLSSANA